MLWTFSSHKISVPIFMFQASRAVILQKAADYIVFMRHTNRCHARDITEIKQQNLELEAKSKSALSHQMWRFVCMQTSVNCVKRMEDTVFIGVCSIKYAAGCESYQINMRSSDIHYRSCLVSDKINFICLFQLRLLSQNLSYRQITS